MPLTSMRRHWLIILGLKNFSGMPGTMRTSSTNVRNTAFAMINCATAPGYDAQMLKVFRSSHKAHGAICKHLAGPLLEFIRYLAQERGGDVGQRRRNLLRDLVRDLRSNVLRFEDSDSSDEAILIIVRFVDSAPASVRSVSLPLCSREARAGGMESGLFRPVGHRDGVANSLGPLLSH